MQNGDKPWLEKGNYSREIQAVMEYELHENYKTLADLKLQKPTIGRLNNISGNLTEKLAELDQLHQRIESSLMGSEYDQLEQYTEKFRHFVHLFFAEEKLELESKFRENVQVRYVRHRSGTANKNKKTTPVYAVYIFNVPAEATEDLVMYQMISINSIRGKITHINRNTNCIEVAFEDRKRTLEFDQNACYCLEIEFNARQYEAFMYSIYFVEQHKVDFVVFPDASELVSKEEFATRLVEFKRKCKTDPKLTRFDQQQQLAIFSIVNGIHGTVPFVLWGPPGTGKTVTLVECVRQLMQQDEKNRILICTPSNTAADLVARRILETDILSPIQMRRYYSLGKSVDERDKGLDTIIKMENCSIYGLYDERFKIDNYAMLTKQNVRLVFATLACSAYLEEEIRVSDFFSHIFIDEAGQSIEPETLIPITRFATRNTRVVLCGDHQQLGPVVKAHFLKAYKSCHLSLMERLMTTMRAEENSFRINGQKSVYTDGRTFCQLTDSYRCHPKIIHFSSVNFYDGTLRAVNEENRKSFCDWKHLPSKNFPLLFHALTKGAEVKQLEGRSYHNEEEVEVVLKYIQLLRETDIEDTEIGVISPYKQQTLKIRDRLAGSRITVDSVECYQGSERRVIIFTLSRSKQIGFLSEFKRLNTSLTRAKELVIVVASLDFVRNLNSKHPNNYWISFIEFCIDNNAVLVDDFVDELGFTQQTLTKNGNFLRKCLKESFHSEFTRIERKKKPEFAVFSAPIRKHSESDSSTSESCDEDEGTVSDLSPLSSSDEEGKQFWAKQIPWRKRPSERNTLRGPKIEEMANAMSKLKTNEDTEDIQYEDLTTDPLKNWPEDGGQDDGYANWNCPAKATTLLSDESRQNDSGNGYGSAPLYNTKTENVTAKQKDSHYANCQQNVSRIPEESVRDQPTHRPTNAQKKDFVAEIATSIEEGSIGATRGKNPLGSDQQNCKLM
ncbi:hypothetical protein niasHT_009464 [Heterodera trifolii]|uniref:RNA helicase n=1 Tax=Heterodera trifolii TaxID=157864 RepID=A0ABD2MFW7_9BILA